MLKRTPQVLAILALVVFVALSSEGMAFAPQHTHTGQTALSPTCYQYACDGRQVDGSTCQQDQIKEIDLAVYSHYQPTRELYEYWEFFSPGCQSAWTAIANRSGVTLTGVTASISRVGTVCHQSGAYCTTGTLSNGAHLSSPMVGWKSGNILHSEACAVDIGGNHGSVCVEDDWHP